MRARVCMRKRKAPNNQGSRRTQSAPLVLGLSSGCSLPWILSKTPLHEWMLSLGFATVRGSEVAAIVAEGLIALALHLLTRDVELVGRFCLTFALTISAFLLLYSNEHLPFLTLAGHLTCGIAITITAAFLRWKNSAVVLEELRRIAMRTITHPLSVTDAVAVGSLIVSVAAISIGRQSDMRPPNSPQNPPRVEASVRIFTIYGVQAAEGPYRLGVQLSIANTSNTTVTLDAFTMHLFVNSVAKTVVLRNYTVTDTAQGIESGAESIGIAAGSKGDYHLVLSLGSLTNGSESMSLRQSILDTLTRQPSGERSSYTSEEVRAKGPFSSAILEMRAIDGEIFKTPDFFQNLVLVGPLKITGLVPEPTVWGTVRIEGGIGSPDVSFVGQPRITMKCWHVLLPTRSAPTVPCGDTVVYF
jgi:hypothetical protein